VTLANDIELTLACDVKRCTATTVAVSYQARVFASAIHLRPCLTFAGKEPTGLHSGDKMTCRQNKIFTKL